MDQFDLFLNNCYAGNLSAVVTFLAEGISPDTQNAEGETALQISAANGNIDIVKVLLREGATVDLSNNYGWTPLMHASRHGHNEVVSFLIEMKAKVNVSNRLGLRPVDLAAWSGSLSCVKLIMDAGAIIDNDKSLLSDVCDISPLIAASLQGHEFVVRTLLENGSAVNQASTITGLTPLMLSAYCGYKSIVETLTEFGGDVNKTDICGRTALDLARVESNKDVIMFLEDLTHLNSRKLSGEIPHDINILNVLRSGDISKVKSLLLLNQNLCNYSDPEDGVTPLMTACMLGFNDIVELLISNGADLNAQDITNGWTPLMYAVFHRQTETVHLLLDKDVDIDICTTNGYTALDLAIHTDNSENNILSTLLAYTDSEELLDNVDNLTTVSTTKRSHLSVEKAPSRSDSQPKFKELLGGISSHLRHLSKSSAVSPVPESEIFDDTLYDVFIEEDAQETSTERNFLCLSAFYAPNKHFAHLIKEQTVEALDLPPLPPHNNSMDLVKNTCLKKDKSGKSRSIKPHFNSLSVPNLLRKMNEANSEHLKQISKEFFPSERLNTQDFPINLLDAGLKSSESMLLESFESKKCYSEVAGLISECSTLKDYSELSQEKFKVSSNNDPKHESESVIESASATGGLTALLSHGSLAKYAEVFRDQEIDLKCFQYLTEEDLHEMGISSFDSRHKLMEIISKFKKASKKF